MPTGQCTARRRPSANASTWKNPSEAFDKAHARACSTLGRSTDAEPNRLPEVATVPLPYPGSAREHTTDRKVPEYSEWMNLSLVRCQGAAISPLRQIATRLQKHVG